MTTATVSTTLPVPSFDHLLLMTDRLGLFEHARFAAPRHEHGYCADDVARALVVALREPTPTPALETATQTYLGFLEAAVTADGSVRNRRSSSGRWDSHTSTGDCWGRTVNALGFAVHAGRTPAIRQRATVAFLRAAQARSVDVRASAFAALGAAEFLGNRTDQPETAVWLLGECLDRIPRGIGPGWQWPEPRLRYANAALCDALIWGGHALGRTEDVSEGLRMLAVLLEIETSPHGHLSVTGTLGRDPGEGGPLWDQQPIEVAVIADACAHAAQVSGDATWLETIDLAQAWFAGANDAGVVVYDAETGAGHDGIMRQGRNENCGAESTLAALSTVQHARAISGLRQ